MTGKDATAASGSNGGRLFREAEAFFFDLDGCIYFGELLAEGADTLIDLLRGNGKKVGFITNNSRNTAPEIANKLAKLGIDAQANDIFTATDYTGKYMMEKYGRRRVKVIGSDGFASALAAAGHEVLPLESERSAEIFAVGRDTAFSYDKLALVAKEAAYGAKVVAANSDLCHPGSTEERVPETGALIAAIEAASGLKAEFVGKPEPHLFLYGMATFGLRPQQCVMVGDNEATDIAGGNRAGMRTIWVSAHGGAFVAGPQADLWCRSLAELLATFR